MGMSRDIADLGLGGGCWVWFSTKWRLPGMGQGCGEGGPDSYKELIQGQSEQILPPPPPPTPQCPDR